MHDLLKKLCGAFGVSGNEEGVREVIIDSLKDIVDEINVDALGNLIAIKKGFDTKKSVEVKMSTEEKTSAKLKMSTEEKASAEVKIYAEVKRRKLMFAAHMDEIGVMVTYVDEKGFLRFSQIGWVSAYYSIGQRIKFKNGTVGVIFYEEKLEDMKNLKLSKLYIDIGASSREDALRKVKIGDVACFDGRLIQQGDMMISKAMDNRSGCAVLIEVARQLEKTENDVYFVFTVQEELGTRGAKPAAFKIMPDMAIAVDITSTGDTPECELMEVKCGKGPAIKVKDRSIMCHPIVKRALETSAKTLGIPFQYEILEHGGTDAGAIHLEVGGILTGAVSIPCRYTHSPVEMVSLTDMELCVKLLLDVTKNYK